MTHHDTNDTRQDVRDGDRDKLVELMRDLPIAMMTTFGGSGIRSVPMSRQEVEPDAEMWFIADRTSRHVADIQGDPRVALTFSSRDAWVALTGHAAVVEDRDRLADLWNTFAEAWLPGGPDNPDAVLLKVDVDQGEYWDTPGGKVASLISFAKTRLTGDTYDAGHGVVGGV
jgi:general stress protein 26